MGAIKDVVDLATQLSESVQDRKFSGDLFKIIQLIHTIQSEQASLTEKNIELMSENAELQSQVKQLQQQLSESQSPSIDGPNISELSKKILLFCSEHGEGVSVAMVQHKFSISGAKSEFELGKLQEAELVDYGSLAMGQDIQFVPTQSGLTLLDENDLI